MQPRAITAIRVLLAAGLAAAAVSLLATLLLAWTGLRLAGAEVALGVMATFWFGGWLVVEPLCGVLAYQWLRRRGMQRSSEGASWPLCGGRHC